MLSIAPSTYDDHLPKRADPSSLSDRARRDKVLRPEIMRVFDDDPRGCGVRKIRRRLGREGFNGARSQGGDTFEGHEPSRHHSERTA